MNSKGFTLIELLFSIAILGLITFLAVAGYSSIAKAIKKNQRNNIIKRIEIAASQYAFDTNETIIFVDKLITEGYIDSDDEDGTINDPVNNERMNCYIIEMEKVSDYYNSKFIDGKNYDENGECDTSKLNEYSEDVGILVNGNTYDNTWLTGDVTLTAHTSNTSLVIDCINNRCAWSSSSGTSLDGTTTYKLSNVSSTLNTKYTFQYTVYDNNTNEIKRYTASIDLKIDNESPTIYGDEMKITNRYIYTDTKIVTIEASDGKGSGIDGYYLGKDISNCNSTNIIYQKSNSFEVSSNGTYIVCVKDAVGNKSSASVNINYIS